MQNAIVDLSVEVSSLTDDAVKYLAVSVGKSTEKVAAFLLREGFSNLLRIKDSRTEFLRK